MIYLKKVYSGSKLSRLYFLFKIYIIFTALTNVAIFTIDNNNREYENIKGTWVKTSLDDSSDIPKKIVIAENAKDYFYDSDNKNALGDLIVFTVFDVRSNNYFDVGFFESSAIQGRILNIYLNNENEIYVEKYKSYYGRESKEINFK